ncbi:nuclear transport factor 2 family protein [Sphingomonas sp. MMS24-JH45]
MLAPLTAILDAIGRSDGAAITAATISDGLVTSVRTGPDGKPQRRTIRWAEFAGSLKPERAGRVKETIGQPAIEVDGDVAMIWAPYTVFVDTGVSHCGVNHVDLVRTEAGWRILNLTYSHRTEGCTAR